jgi:hypothetical protein
MFKAFSKGACSGNLYSGETREEVGINKGASLHNCKITLEGFHHINLTST